METHLLQERVRQSLILFYQQRAERLMALKLEDVLTIRSEHLWLSEETSVPSLLARLIEAYLTSFEQWWNTLLQNREFCLQANRLRHQITTPRYSYQDQLAYAHNRLVLDFVNHYCRPDYAIDWEKLLRYNSGAD